MPLYYFDCFHRSCQEECIGHDLADQDAAHKLAIEFAGELLQSDPDALAEGHSLSVTVSDEQHFTLFSFTATSVSSATASGH